MKLVVSSSDLLKGILTVSKAVPPKSSEPILENFLFALKGSKLQITGSDSELTLRTEVDVENTIEEGQMAVPAKQITDLLKELPDQPITISTVGESTFTCAWSTGESTLPYLDAADYPQIQTVGEGASTIEVSSESLAEGISGTVYAAAEEDNRPIMKSIFFDITADSTTLVASDLQKLICYTADDVKALGNSSFILNKRHAMVLRSILGKDDTVKISFDDKFASFQFGNSSAICCLVLGRYPAYKSIIPQNNSNILTISRTQLLNTVKRIAVCSPKASNHIKFDLSAGSLEVSAQDTGFMIAAHEKVACSYEGDDLVIGFKSTHITEILSNMACDTVVMKFADRRRSVLVLPSEEEASSVKTFAIVMPIMVR